MHRLLKLAIIALALAGAGVAVADNVGTKAVKQVSASFNATNVTTLNSKSCTSGGDTFVQTHARYTGDAISSDTSLNGPITLDVHSLIDTTKNVGTIDGTLKIAGSPGNSVAHLNGTYAGGQFDGLANGHAGTSPASHLLANTTASFSAAGGFSSGKIGASGTGAGLELSNGACEPTKAKKGKQEAEARGSISAVSTTSITVGGVTCAVPASLAAKLAGLHMGDRVSIHCQLVNGTLTLTEVSKHGKK